MLNNPSVALHEISVNLFEPFCPMLSQRCEITDDSKIMKTIKSYLLTLNWTVKDFNFIGLKKKTFLNIFPGMLINVPIIYIKGGYNEAL
jgi:hypothetical protein